MNLNELIERTASATGQVNAAAPLTLGPGYAPPRAFQFNDILSSEGPVEGMTGIQQAYLSTESNTPTVMSSTPVPAINMPSNQIYYLPIAQTDLQKELISLVMKLHKNNLITQLNSQKESNTDSNISKDDTKSTDDLNSNYLSDESMIDLFLHGIKDITIHSSLLIPHYMPSRILQMETKKDITFGSSKFQVLDHILNSLMSYKEPAASDIDSTVTGKSSKRSSNKETAAQVPKKIILTAANSKELDLIESLLLGKKYQYYRFSGSSIYYENHGAFDYNYQAYVDSLQEETDKVAPKKKRTYTKKGKNKDKEKDSRDKEGSESSAIAAPKREYKKKNKDKEKERDPANATPSPAKEKTNGGDKTSQVGRPRRKKVRDEDYVSPLSKNSIASIKKNNASNPHKLNHNVQIYLILSNQIKSLLYNNKEYKTDLIISLDSTISEIHANPVNGFSYNLGKNNCNINNNPNEYVPILKLVPLNSIEHVLIKLNEFSPHNSINIDDIETKELVTYLTIISIFGKESKFHIEADEYKTKLNDLVPWIFNLNKVQFPFHLSLDTIQGSRLSKDEIFNKAYDILVNEEGFGESTSLYKLNKYEYFDKSKAPESNSPESKKLKLSTVDGNESIESKMSLSTYKQKLTSLFYSRFEHLKKLNQEAKEILDEIHLDDSKRQRYLEEKIEKTKLDFTKLQNDKTAATNVERQSDKNESDLAKLKETISVLEKRKEIFTKHKVENEGEADAVKEGSVPADDEIKKLEEELKNLEKEVRESSEGEDQLRIEYQERSSKAAELSLEMTNLNRTKESICKELEGPGLKLNHAMKDNELELIEAQIKQLSLQNNFIELHVSKLTTIVKERTALFNNVMGSRSSRYVRSSTPY